MNTTTRILFVEVFVYKLCKVYVKGTPVLNSLAMWFVSSFRVKAAASLLEHVLTG